MLSLPCPCGQILRLPESRLGTSVRCSKCGGTVDIPSAKPTPTVPGSGEKKSKKPRFIDGPPAAQKKKNSPETKKPLKVPVPKRGLEQTGSVIADPEIARQKRAEGEQPDRKPSGHQSEKRVPGPEPKEKKMAVPEVPVKKPEVRSKTTPPPLPKERRNPGTPSGLAETKPPPKPPVPPPPPPIKKQDKETSVPLVDKTVGPSKDEQRLQSETQEAATDSTMEAKPEPVAGVFYDPSQLLPVYLFAMGLIALAIVQLVPAIWEIQVSLATEERIVIGRWVWPVFFIAALQIVYAVYLAQLPDWSSVWVVAIGMLAMTMLFAALQIVLLLSQPDNELIQLLDLQYAIQNGKAKPWCVLLLLTHGIFTYLAGHISVRWHRKYREHWLSQSDGHDMVAH
jgi:hypothetical protein